MHRGRIDVATLSETVSNVTVRRPLSVAVIVGIALLASSSATAQKDRSEINARLAALIRARIESQQPLQLSAETITLTGDTLRLAGRAWIRFNDVGAPASPARGASIQAEEIVVNPVTKRIDLLGTVRAFLGPDVAPPAPRIEFR